MRAVKRERAENTGQSPTPNHAPPELQAAFETHRAFLWGLLYRLTGTVGDADDLVQETFLRLLTSPPARLDLPLRPWLTRVAVNLGRDLLRQRRRTRLKYYWLPGPCEISDDMLIAPLPTPPAHPLTSEQRYELMERASMAYLEALEALTPQQRAVLVLREVCELSVEEVGQTLGLSPSNVKVSHHRARRAMVEQSPASQESHPWNGLTGDASGSEHQTRNLEALQQFLYRMAAGDVEGMAALLTQDAKAVSDGGGVYLAARLPVIGALKVAKFFEHLMRQRKLGGAGALRMLNGLPAYVHQADTSTPGLATRSIMTVELDAEGKIALVRTFLSPYKLVGIDFENLPIRIPGPEGA